MYLQMYSGHISDIFWTNFLNTWLKLFKQNKTVIVRLATERFIHRNFVLTVVYDHTYKNTQLNNFCRHSSEKRSSRNEAGHVGLLNPSSQI